MIPDLATIVEIIHLRQSQRASAGEKPLREMHISPEVYAKVWQAMEPATIPLVVNGVTLFAIRA